MYTASKAHSSKTIVADTLDGISTWSNNAFIVEANLGCVHYSKNCAGLFID